MNSYIAELVARRDRHRCIAPTVDRNVGWCHDRWGHVITRWPVGRIDRDKITYAHVKDADAQAMGKKAPTDPEHLVLLCWGHHEGVGERGGYCWGTSRDGLAKQRAYLERYGVMSPRTAV